MNRLSFFTKLIVSLLTVVLLTGIVFPFVTKAAVQRIVITPDVTCMKIGETVTFRATAYDETGAIIHGQQFRWLQEGPGKGSVSGDKASYTFIATTPGTIRIHVSADGVQVTKTFEVGNTQVRNVQIRVTPNTAGELATYYIIFNTDKCGQLEPGDTIYLAFPYGTKFIRYSGCNAVTVNGIPASYYIEEDKNDNQIVSITVPRSFPESTQVYIRICKVQNPRGGACYRMAVATSKQPYWSLSNSYAIEGSIITTPTVEVEPDIVGENAAYTIRFETSTTGRLGSCYGGYIMVEFPYGTKIPTDISAEHVLVNGQYCNEADPVVNGRVVKIYPGMVVLEESEVVVEFLLEAGIVNPGSSDQYRLVVWTNADNTRVNSNYYRIRNSVIKNVEVWIDKPFINTTSEWKITFTTGLVGTMRENGVITIYFPSSVTLPDSSVPGDIRVNGVSTIKPAKVEGAGTLKIFTPVALESESPVEIVIKEVFGLQNPSMVGRYTIKVHTGKEGTNVESSEFEIGPSVIADLSVRIESPYVTVPTAIELSFQTGGGGKLTSENGQIFIIMPRGMYIPNAIRRDAVLVNGNPMKTTPFLKKAENQIVLNVPVDIEHESEVLVRFTKEAGIRNPITPGEYLFRVATSREVSYISSSKIPIHESTVRNVTVDLLEKTISQETSLHLTFTTGPAGDLSAGDKVYIFVDTKFQFPSDYQNGIIFNGANLDLFPVMISPDSGKIQINIPEDIAENEDVFIQITKEAGFKNPSVSGDYSIGISTAKESQTISSNTFHVIDLPKTELTVLPAFPDGENDWYVTEPEITFTVYSEEPETITTWFSLNGEEWIQYKEPLKLSSGEFEIKYYSKQGDAKEPIQSYSVAVDTLPPYLQLPDEGIYTNKKAYTLEIPVIDSHFAKGYVGEIEINSLVDGKLRTIVVLEEGDNVFSVVVFDQAGNRTEKNITIILDQTPPELVIEKPQSWDKTVRKYIVINGYTEDSADVTLNGKRLPLIDGSFTLQYECSPGVNALEFIATDKAGNVTKQITPVQYYKDFWVEFVIGQQIANSAMGKIDLGSAVFIQESNAMVPLAVFTNLLGCTIEFESVFQILTITDPEGIVIQAQIGNKTITVNDEKKQLPTPPVIRNGRTFVPLRFLAEEFGFIVEYIKEKNIVKMEFHED